MGPMLSSPRKPPSNTLLPSASLRFTHHVKFRSILWRMRSRKSKSLAAVDLEHAQRGQGVHGRVHVAERPLVGRQLAVRVHVPRPAQQEQLLLGEGGVDVGQRDAVEGEVPRRVPRVLPRVGHRDDVAVVEVPPAGVAPGEAGGRRGGTGRVAVQPLLHVVVVELLRPQHPGHGLAQDHGLVGGGRVGVSARRRSRRPPAGAPSSWPPTPSSTAAALGREAQPHLGRLARRARSARGGRPPWCPRWSRVHRGGGRARRGRRCRPSGRPTGSSSRTAGRRWSRCRSRGSRRPASTARTKRPRSW